MQAQNKETSNSHGCIVVAIVIILIAAAIFGIVKLVQYRQTENAITNEANSDGAVSLFTRAARPSDILVDSELDLSSLGAKYSVTAQTDIDDLVISISFLDKDRNILASTTKTIGNIKEGQQINFTISLFDMSLSTAWNTKYETWAVTGGTVSYFA